MARKKMSAALWAEKNAREIERAKHIALLAIKKDLVIGTNKMQKPRKLKDGTFSVDPSPRTASVAAAQKYAELRGNAVKNLCLLAKSGKIGKLSPQGMPTIEELVLLSREERVIRLQYCLDEGVMNQDEVDEVMKAVDKHYREQRQREQTAGPGETHTPTE